MNPRVVLLVALAAFPAALPPTFAAELPIAFTEERFNEPGWGIVRFSTNGTSVEFTVISWNLELPYFQMVGLYYPNGTPYYTYHRGQGSSGRGALVEASAGPVEDVRISRHYEYVPDAAGWGSGIGLHFPSLPPGTYDALFIAAGGQTGWSMRLYGPPGNVILDRVVGTSVFAPPASEWRGVAGVHAGELNLGASATVLADYAVDLPGTLIGAYSGPGVTSVTTPAGEVVCPCVFTSFTGPKAPGPGRYVFHATGVPQASLIFASTMLGGAAPIRPGES